MINIYMNKRMQIRYLCITAIFVSILGVFPLKAQQSYSTAVNGTITVDEALDPSGDYSGIIVSILGFGEFTGIDTLLTAVTDVNGNFSGTARFDAKREFTATVSRHGVNLASFGIILADGDPVTITGQLPDLNLNLEVQSAEQDAMNTYQRVERSYNRVIDFINSGMVEVTQDTIPTLINTWSDLFWSVQTMHPQTLAGDLGSLRSVEILGGFDDEKLVKRMYEALSGGSVYKAAKVRLGADALFRLEGVEPALSLVDSMLTTKLQPEDLIVLQMDAIEIRIEHGREQEAKNLLMEFREQHSDNPMLADWVETMVYDIENLFPGMYIPEFSLQLQRGGRIQNTDIREKLFLIEFANFANPEFQTETTLLTFFYQQNSERGFQVITIPIHDSRITVNAFIEDRNIPWPVVAAGQYNAADLASLFNLSVLPTRLLVDSEGRIVRKYSGTNIGIIQNDISILLNEESQ
jgi:peroxiredoxin